jgi:universal stress protein A
MLTIRQILVPIDFSAPSRAALEHAAGLAERLDATVVVLHTWEQPSYFGPEGVLIAAPGVVHPGLDEVRRSVERELAQFVAGAALPAGTDLRVVSGRPAEAILEAAAEPGIDMIVMGTHGRSGLARMIVGSVAEAVIRHAPCPVLTLRAPQGDAEADET